MSPSAFESAYDYDPFWAKCLDFKVAVTAHSGSMGWDGRASVNSFTYNHIGHFANASHAFAKALVLGGVMHRFPKLKFALLVGHFDVVDMTAVLEDAYELVEHGLITEDDFRDFVFGNTASLHSAMNPDFFKGTVVEQAVAKEAYAAS